MAKVSVSITHCAWRDGRPRFVPGPRLRKLGFTGLDLKTPQGKWMTAAQSAAWITAKEAEIATRQVEVDKAKAAKRATPALRTAPGELSVEGLFELYWASPAMSGDGVVEGRRKQKSRAPRTIKDYKQKAGVLSRFDGDIWTGSVEALTQPIVFDLYERVWSKHGLATARGVVLVLSGAISWGMRRGKVHLVVNPCMRLGMELPQPRVRALTPAEVRHLIATADAMERPEIGDAIALGVWTGQRQGDRLGLVDAGLMDGRRVFRQGKTGAIVAIRQTPELEERLKFAALRRWHWASKPDAVIVDEKTMKPFKGDWYRHLFAEVRAAAAKSVPSVADVRDQDLRDTAVTWLARAGCTHSEIAQITGHSQASVQSILKHYLASHPEIADNAIKKLVAWYEGQAITDSVETV